MNLRQAAAALAAVGSALVLAAAPAVAGPRFVAHGSDAMVVLYDEPCAFGERVTNLPLRATWNEPDGKVIEGCWGVNGLDLVLIYFEDRTVASYPKDLFSRIGKT